MCHLILFLPFFALPVFWIFPLPGALSIYLLVLGVSLLFYFKIFQAMRIAPGLGKEAMVGKTATVIKDIAPEGKIKYSSEIWSALSEGRPFYTGDQVLIQGFWGMKLLVKETPADGAKGAGKSCHQARGREKDENPA